MLKMFKMFRMFRMPRMLRLLRMLRMLRSILSVLEHPRGLTHKLPKTSGQTVFVIRNKNGAMSGPEFPR